MDDRFTSPSPLIPQEHFFADLVRFAIIAVLVVFPIRLFIAQPFIVAGASMEPTFENGQYLIIDEITYRLEDPERGDVIIFRYPRDPSKFFIKRIIALPGETITVEGVEVSIRNKTHPDGFVLDEPYINDMRQPTTLSQTLGKDEYFVLGDNRDASSDSRVWGVLKRDLIIGRAFLRLLPIGSASVFPGYSVPTESTSPRQE
ncbi:signal peptidase I [Candidatus Kaiserbacteria bacterium]|nr:signal peptidase I [Candidatus Kaiserbacteria bacterium]